MSGFWAGAVPPWAFVALVALVILVILGIVLGQWTGYGRGWKHAEEEARWAREQAKARRAHPVYRQPSFGMAPELAHDDVWQRLAEFGPVEFGPVEVDPVAVEDWLAHEDQALAVANGQAVTTGEIQAITDETDVMVARWRAENDVWLAEHVYSAPADYGQWLEQQDR